MWGVGVCSEVGVLIHPTGVLWNSGQDSGLASLYLERYCPQTLPSQTLIYDREHCHADTDNRHHQTGLLPQTVCNRSKCPSILPRLNFHAVLREGQVHSMKTPPHCNATSSKFHSWHYTCRQVSFSRHSPHPNPPIRLPYGIVWLITPNHTFPIVHCPVASLFTQL
jgi:hypothetical protein